MQVNAQHRLGRKGWAPAFVAGRRRMRRDECHQFGPGHDLVHFRQKRTLARGFALEFEAARRGKARLLHGLTVSHMGDDGLVLQRIPSRSEV